MRARLASGLLGLVIATLATPTRAEEVRAGMVPGQVRIDTAPTEPAIYELAHTGPLFLAGEFVGAAGIALTYTLLAGDTPRECGWCNPNSLDESMRDIFMMKNSRAAATWSHVLSLGVTPAVAFAGAIVPAAMNDQGGFAVQDIVVMLNAFTLSTGLALGTKKLAARPRPAFYYEREDETEYEDRHNQEFLAFYSGDTSWAFTMASAGATLAFQRGYWTAPYVAAIGGASAVATGVFRVAADAHWASDAVAGAFAGSVVGFSIPMLLHPRAGRVPVAVVPAIAPGRFGLAASGVF